MRSQWKTTLKTVRRMTNTQIKSVLVGGHPETAVIFLPFLNTKQLWPKGSNVVRFEEVRYNLFLASRVFFFFNWLNQKNSLTL